MSKEKYAISMMAEHAWYNPDDGYQRSMRHVVGVVEATSEAEALGLAYLIAQKLLPTDKGWSKHNVIIANCNNVMTLENAAIATPSSRV